MRTTILLTGGFGNLGGRLAAYFHQQQVFSIRLGSRTERNAPPWAPDAQTTRLDVLDIASLNMSLSDVDIVVHLAAMNDIECANDPGLAQAVNVEGTRNLLESSITAGVSRIIYLSTAHVYGAPLVGRIDESTIPHPQHPYGVTHLAAEHLIQKVHDGGQITGVRIRSANGFGAPMDPVVNIWHILVNDLCRQATEHGTLTLKSHGNQERNFVPLHDVCTAISHLINLDPQCVGDGLFNLGHKDSTSVWNMTQLIATRCEAVLGFSPPIIRPPAEPHEKPQSLDFRSDKLRTTGFVPRGDLDAEIDELLTFCSREFPRRL
ncbi:MAG: NAD-dependent epimerase/dehydratase family protein [Ilumatobacteraceae bacterium]